MRSSIAALLTGIFIVLMAVTFSQSQTMHDNHDAPLATLLRGEAVTSEAVKPLLGPDREMIIGDYARRHNVSVDDIMTSLSRLQVQVRP